MMLAVGLCAGDLAYGFVEAQAENLNVEVNCHGGGHSSHVSASVSRCNVPSTAKYL
jgi:hypothetical protein